MTPRNLAADGDADWPAADDVMMTPLSPRWKSLSSAWSETTWTPLLCSYVSNNASVDDVAAGTRYPTAAAAAAAL